MPVMWNRSAVTTALELAEALRYLPDAAMVLAIAIVLVAISPAREPVGGGGRAAPSGRGTVPVAATVVAALAISSLTTAARSGGRGTTIRLGRISRMVGRRSPNIPTSRCSIRRVPLEVLLPVTFPDNQISRVFGGLRHGPTIVTSTSNLMVLDTKGRLVRAE